MGRWYLDTQTGSRRAPDGLKLQQDADDDEDDVEDEHENAHDLAHAPAAHSDDDDDGYQHEEKEDDGAEQALAVHMVWLASEHRPKQQPWNWKPAQQVNTAAFASRSSEGGTGGIIRPSILSYTHK